MPTFEYIARNGSGDRVTGLLEAGNETVALQMLDEQQLFPVRVSERDEQTGGGGVRRMRTAEMAVLFDELADLLRAGVPMLRALETLGRTNSKESSKAIISGVSDGVSEGKSLADAMAEQGGVFSELQCAMVKAGERGGFLEEVLHSLAVYLERRDQLRAKVTGALIYPFLLVLAGVAAVTVCLTWLVPKFKPLFEGQELPLPSEILFAASDLIVEHWQVTAAGAFMVLVALLVLSKTDVGRRLWSRGQLKVPVLGKVLLMLALTRFCRILGTMLASGVPILQALSIARDAAGCPPLAEAIDEAAESVRQGQGLTPPLRESKLIPDQLLEMIAVAEESNQLEKVLLKIADTVERRTNQQVDQAVRLLEPAILVLLAGGILFIALGILYPIFTMSQSIR